MPFLNENILFIHIPKNAGRSIEEAFGLPPREKYRRNLRSRLAKYMLRKSANEAAIRHLYGSYDYTFAAQHLTFAEIQMLQLGNDNCDYCTFTVFRNPLERFISTLSHFAIKLVGDRLSLSNVNRVAELWLARSYHDHNELAHSRQQVDYLRALNGSKVDYIINFEHLQDGLNMFCHSVGEEYRALPHKGKDDRARDIFAGLSEPIMLKFCELMKEDLGLWEVIKTKKLLLKKDW